MSYLHIENLYKCQDILLFRECYALEKIHGTSTAAVQVLRAAGERLWNSLKAHPVSSLNRGRRTISFRPFRCTADRDVIDTALTEAASLPAPFVDELRRFERSTEWSTNPTRDART